MYLSRLKNKFPPGAVRLGVVRDSYNKKAAADTRRHELHKSQERQIFVDMFRISSSFENGTQLSAWGLDNLHCSFANSLLSAFPTGTIDIPNPESGKMKPVSKQVRVFSATAIEMFEELSLLPIDQRPSYNMMWFDFTVPGSNKTRATVEMALKHQLLVRNGGSAILAITTTKRNNSKEYELKKEERRVSDEEWLSLAKVIEMCNKYGYERCVSITGNVHPLLKSNLTMTMYFRIIREVNHVAMIEQMNDRMTVLFKEFKLAKDQLRAEEEEAQVLSQSNDDENIRPSSSRKRSIAPLVASSQDKRDANGERIAIADELVEVQITNAPYGREFTLVCERNLYPIPRKTGIYRYRIPGTNRFEEDDFATDKNFLPLRSPEPKATYCVNQKVWVQFIDPEDNGTYWYKATLKQQQPDKCWLVCYKGKWEADQTEVVSVNRLRTLIANE